MTDIIVAIVGIFAIGIQLAMILLILVVAYAIFRIVRGDLDDITQPNNSQKGE